jgi:hypothetical protein
LRGEPQKDVVVQNATELVNLDWGGTGTGLSRPIEHDAAVNCCSYDWTAQRVCCGRIKDFRRRRFLLLIARNWQLPDGPDKATCGC